MMYSNLAEAKSGDIYFLIVLMYAIYVELL